MPFYTVNQVIWVRAESPEEAQRITQLPLPVDPSVLLISTDEPVTWDLETTKENLATLATLEWEKENG